jgi:hypothetical protein
LDTSDSYNRKGTSAFAAKSYAAAIDMFTAALAVERIPKNGRVVILCLGGARVLFL